MEVSVFWTNQNFSNFKQKAKRKKKSFVELTEQYLKIEEYVNIYDCKLFARNYSSECSEVLLKFNFVISEMKLYLMNFSF